MNSKKLEKYLFGRYKHWVNKKLEERKKYVHITQSTSWLIIFEFERILNEFFDYDFPYNDLHYYCIKNEKTIFEYNINE